MRILEGGGIHAELAGLRRRHAREKLASEPPRNSPIAVATSLADRVTRDLMAFSTVMVEPALTPSLEGGSAAALRDTGIGVLVLDATRFHRLEEQIERHDLGQ